MEENRLHVSGSWYLLQEGYVCVFVFVDVLDWMEPHRVIIRN
jgi:hypothetical protein